MMENAISLSQNFENFELDSKTVSNSKQKSQTADRQSSSQAFDQLAPLIVIQNIYENNYKEEEITSLVKVKDFDDYVKQAIETGLLDEQYEVSSSFFL